MSLLLDPRIFNYLILALFALAAIRWAIAQDWAQCFYWIGALILNIAVTFMAAK